ncbi:type I secretion C-terminal target domain (VC_A0849 subclass) [Syntrophus gentianae]|uniref:Type I secretion C-terminal target domain (VC_A0849 subclass) n=1 Tax=Syntrophus gentianae TaxID=43775 RepID=A0A1H7ZR43_9BACT|nr:calcium-binding protein [Syntrophus gentianae]SEM59847.1 type I secretion C-terminal target domain (VC_A0849 subclass) [Syntrophus gentianae]
MATKYGTDGNDKIYGTTEADYLYGKGGDDIIYGKAGDDYLSGGAGSDTMSGNAGNDTYVVDSVGDVVIELAGYGTDKIKTYIDYTLGDNVENLSLYGEATTGKGNSLANEIKGNSNADSLYGYDGNDRLYGNDGNDYLNGGTGNDYLNGGSGSDELYGYAGNDELYGYAGNDNLYGNVGDDYLSSGTGNDYLYGNDGNDRLYGDNGNDYLKGGTGSDDFIFRETGAANSDTIADFSHDQSDTIVLKDILDGVSDSIIEGLDFIGGVLNADCYFEDDGYTGDGAEDRGIYYDTETGDLWYNPTTGEAGDSVQICTLVGTEGTYASLLDAADITYSA